jgi:hypothetical protein
MSIDQRTRRHCDVRDLSRDEVFDSFFPASSATNGALAARGRRYKALPSLGFDVDGRTVTLVDRDGVLVAEEGDANADAVAALDASALSELVQDRKSAMGLAMNAQVKMRRGRLDTWIGWEPVFRALFDARPVHEAGAVDFRQRDGAPLDLTKSFTLDDDHAEISHFLHEAGFLHVENVFAEEEMNAVSADLDAALAGCRKDDGASWWATDRDGADHPVRVLWFHEQSDALSKLLHDDRLQWLSHLTGDEYDGRTMGAEGLIKPIGITKGLSDLPWHKDCGQGMHAYMCSGMTVGISVTGADKDSGALGVVPGTHRANCQSSGIDPSLDLQPLKLETKTGDLTVHCSDTLHRAHPPKTRARKVVYTGFRMKPKAGDVVQKLPAAEERARRARLSNVEDRISASDGDR